MQHDPQRLRACAHAVATAWASTAYRSRRQREFGASCLRVAILNVLGQAPQDDAIALMGKEPSYRRVADKFASGLEGFCADTLERYRDEL